MEDRGRHTKHSGGDPLAAAQCPELTVTEFMAGFLTYPAIRRLPIAGAKVTFAWGVVGLTAAGTVQDFHLLPSQG